MTRSDCRCFSPCTWDKPCAPPSPSRCGKNHNRSTGRLEDSWYQFFRALRRDCFRYHHHLSRSPPNRNDMEMFSVVNLHTHTRKMKINEFHVKWFLSFHACATFHSTLCSRTHPKMVFRKHTKANVNKREIRSRAWKTPDCRGGNSRETI